ncbi:MAG: TonB-dependent receptor [Sphingomonadales bacterium]|jgi:TonB-dependent receptor
MSTRKISGILVFLLAGTAQGAMAQSSAAPAGVSAEPARAPEIVVTAQRTEKNARESQFAAPNLINIQPAETIAKYPDYNAAEALGRIPGVALSIDTGEGRFVNIRGLDGNLNGATFGGMVLLNTQPGGTYFNAAGRAVEFDTVPIGAIDKITVIKTGLPDRDAEGLGGQVELTPRSAIGRDKPFLDLQLGGGYQPLRSTGLYRVDASAGGGFGRNVDGDRLFHLVVNLFQHEDRRGIDDVEAGYSDQQPGIPDKAFSALELRRYVYNRRRYGATSEFDITPNADNRFFLRASLAGYTERVNRQRLEIDGLDGSNGSGIITTAPGNAKGFAVPDASAVKTLRDEEEAHRNLLLQLGGEHKFGGVKLDWFAGLSRSTYQKYFDRNASFSGPGDSGFSPTGTFGITYDNTTNPNVPVFATPGVNLADPRLYALKRVTNSVEYDRDLEHSFAANLTVSPGLADNDELKFGAKLRLREKFSLLGSSRVNGTGQPLSLYVSGDPMRFYNDTYALGPFIDRNAIYAQFGQALAIPPLQMNAGNTSFDDREDIIAGYGQYRATFGKLGVLAGLRVEHTTAYYGGYVDVVAANGNTNTQFNNIRTAYTNAFPTLQLRYAATDSLILRATYSTGIARPGFLQTIQRGQVDLGAQTVTTGNPNLKPTYGNSFDLSVEYYLPDNGIISFGVFDKEFSNYIVARTFRAPYAPSGSNSIFTYQSFQNVSGAFARGVEASYVNKFKGLPAPFDGLGMDLNIAYVDSGVSLRNGEASRLLPGTFRWTGNAALAYEKGPVQLRVAGEYGSKTLFGIGGSPATDVYQDQRFTLDFYANYDLTRQASLYFTAKNLLNTPLRFYENTANRPIQREFYQQTFEAGVKFRF